MQPKMKSVHLWTIGKCVTQNLSKQTDVANVHEVSEPKYEVLEPKSSRVPSRIDGLNDLLRSQTSRHCNEGGRTVNEIKSFNRLHCSPNQNQVEIGRPRLDPQKFYHFTKKSASNNLDEEFGTIESEKVSITLGKEKTNQFMNGIDPA